MTRPELVTRIAEMNPHLYERECKVVVNTILGTIMEALANGDRAELRGFGAVSTTDLRARQGRNPTTGESVAVKEKTAVAFRPPGLDLHAN